MIALPLTLRRGVIPMLAALASFGQDVGPLELVHGLSEAPLEHLLRHLPM